MGSLLNSMHKALQTTVIGSYPFPGWLEFASQHLDSSVLTISVSCRTTLCQ